MNHAAVAPTTTSAPPALEIDRLSLPELEALLARVEKRIKTKREETQAEALSQIAQLVSTAGLTSEAVAQTLGLAVTKRPVSRKGSKIPPKYRDPNKPANVWSGRGRTPKWLSRYEESGGRREDCLISPAGEQSGGAG